MRKLSHREELAQDHTARKGQSQDSKPGSKPNSYTLSFEAFEEDSNFEIFIVGAKEREEREVLA